MEKINLQLRCNGIITNISIEETLLSQNIASIRSEIEDAFEKYDNIHEKIESGELNLRMFLADDSDCEIVEMTDLSDKINEIREDQSDPSQETKIELKIKFLEGSPGAQLPKNKQDEYKNNNKNDNQNDNQNKNQSGSIAMTPSPSPSPSPPLSQSPSNDKVIDNIINDDLKLNAPIELSRQFIAQNDNKHIISVKINWRLPDSLRILKQRPWIYELILFQILDNNNKKKINEKKVVNGHRHWIFQDLKFTTKYCVRVRINENNNRYSQWSDYLFFDTMQTQEILQVMKQNNSGIDTDENKLNDVDNTQRMLYKKLSCFGCSLMLL